MRSQRFVPHRFPIAFMVGLFLLSVLPATAQGESHPPQFLYRDEDRLIFVNGETGDVVELPDIEVEDTDR